ncbi:UNVERIFIED_CONTAM: branched-chain amino acid transport system permease protein [Brevibacillus sp. OAP136]
MTASTILAGAFNGLLLGGLYAIAALGLSLVFGVMRQINVAHGELLILTAYLNFALMNWLGLDPLLSLVIIIPVMFVFGYLIQFLLINPVTGRGDEPPLLTAFGISIFLANGFILLWRADSRSLSAPYATSGINLFGIQVPVIYLITFALAALVIAGIGIWMKRSLTGKAIRAAALDATTAKTLGINPMKLYPITYGIATAVTAIGGTLLGMIYSFVPSSGATWLLKGFVVVVLGGLGSINGTLLAGLLLGSVEGIGGSFLGTGYKDLIGYLIFLIVLFIRPSGLLGRKYD